MAKLPSLPPSPMWLAKQVPEKFRPLAFVPLALVLGVLAFAFLGLILTNVTDEDFLVALVLGVLAGPVLAYACVGAPFTRAGLAKVQEKIPRPPPEKRPFLFFPAFLILAALFYFVLGVVVTGTTLEEDVLALLALAVAVPAAVAIAYVVYGFPVPEEGLRGLRSPLSRVPPEKRPLLFIPLALVLAAPVYFLAGYALTETLDADVAVLLALLLGLAAGFAASWRLVGPPRTDALRQALQRIPEVPVRARPAAFFLMVLGLGTLVAVALGGTVGALDVVNVDLAFPLFLLAGWLLAVPLAGKLFGYPVPSQPLRAYLPSLPADLRPALLLPLTVGLGLLLMFLLGTVLGLVPLGDLEDAALSAALAFPLALLVALRVLGFRTRALDPRAVPDRLPERAKPLVVVTVWLFLGTLLFALVGQELTTFPAAVLVSYALGLGAAIALVDHPFFGDLLTRRAQRRRLEREIEGRLRREMGLEPEAGAEADSGAEPRRGFLRRRGG